MVGILKRAIHDPRFQTHAITFPAGSETYLPNLTYLYNQPISVDSSDFSHGSLNSKCCTIEKNSARHKDFQPQSVHSRPKLFTQFHSFQQSAAAIKVLPSNELVQQQLRKFESLYHNKMVSRK
jgi:hypothetical protein